MTRLYDYLAAHTALSQENRFRLCLYAGIFCWTATGIVLGLILDLIFMQEISLRFVSGTGSFLGVIVGYLFNLLRLYDHG